jgi:hypothetical protein
MKSLNFRVLWKATEMEYIAFAYLSSRFFIPETFLS